MRSSPGFSAARGAAAVAWTAIAFAASGCGDEPPPPKTQPVAFVAPEAITSPVEEPLPDLRFADVTAESGVTFPNCCGFSGSQACSRCSA